MRDDLAAGPKARETTMRLEVEGQMALPRIGVEGATARLSALMRAWHARRAELRQRYQGLEL